MTERDALISSLNGGPATRADVLSRITEDEAFEHAKRNEAFVMMEYFGYLRRDPDESGYQYWPNKLNQFDGNFERAEMVRAFYQLSGIPSALRAVTRNIPTSARCGLAWTRTSGNAWRNLI